MRALFLVPLLLLAGCNSIARQNGDDFEVGGDPARFVANDQACTVLAHAHLAYDLPVLDDSSYGQNRAFNALYGRCMTAQGHRPRAYVKNWLPGG